MNSTTILILVATVAVIALTLIPTYIISGRKKTTQADWEVADRSLPLYVVIGTQFASAMGGGILVAHVGNAYTRGIGHFIYGVLASLPFIIIMVLAKWLRRNNFTTIPDVLAHFTNGNKLIRIVAGVMTVFVPFGWVTSQITAFGNIYSNLTGIDYTLLCVLFAVFALAFVLPSGLKTVAWTDFIFSTIGEAWGFVGCAAVVIVYLLIILRMMYLARYTADRFGQMVILGVMAMLLFHVFENVGMTTGLMPVTGIPLPFLSYGGSNLVTNMGGIGLVLNVVKNRSITSMPGLAPQTRIRGKYTK